MDVDGRMPATPPRRLPVWAVVTRAYSYVWEHRRPFALPVAVLFIAVFAATILSQRSGMAAESDPVSIGTAISAILGFLLKTAVSIAFAVGVHRTVLLDEGREGLAFFRWDENFRRYFLTLLLIMAIIIGFAVAAGMVGGIAVWAVPDLVLAGGKLVGVALGLIGLVLVIALAGTLMRVFLALPAAALGERSAISLSWRASRGNGGRLFGAGFLASLPFTVAGVIAEAPYIINVVAAMSTQPHAPPPPPGLGTLVANALVAALSAPVLITVLSLSYDVLVRGGGPRPEPS